MLNYRGFGKGSVDPESRRCGIHIEILPALHMAGAILCVLTLILSLAFEMSLAAKKRTVSIFVYSAPEQVPIYKECFKLFQEKTGIAVDFDIAPGSEVEKWQQVVVRMAGGVSPDIVGAVSVEFVQYAAQGLIRPVDDLIKRDHLDLSGLVPSLLSAFRWQGKQYILPYGASGLPLACNDDLFEAGGVQPPPKRWGDPTWNWRSFLDAMVKLTVRESSGKVKRFGLAGPYWDSWITLPYNWGGDWIDPSLSRFMGDEPEAIASVQALQDLRWRYHVMPQPDEGASLLNATAALSGWGTWAIEALRKSDLTLRVAPWFQVGNHKPVGVINPMGLALLSSAPHPEEAWELIKFVTTDPRGNLLYARARGAVPAVTEAQREWVRAMETGTSNAPNLNLICFIQQVMEHAAIVNIRKLTNFNDINRVMEGIINQVLNNEKSAEQAMREVAPRINALIKQGKP